MTRRGKEKKARDKYTFGVCAYKRVREKREGEFVLKNYLTSNIKNDIRRTKSDFAIPIQGINMETLFLSQFLPLSKPRLYVWIYAVLDLNMSLCIFQQRIQ